MEPLIVTWTAISADEVVLGLPDALQPHLEELHRLTRYTGLLEEDSCLIALEDDGQLHGYMGVSDATPEVRQRALAKLGSLMSSYTVDQGLGPVVLEPAADQPPHVHSCVDRTADFAGLQLFFLDVVTAAWGATFDRTAFQPGPGQILVYRELITGDVPNDAFTPVTLYGWAAEPPEPRHYGYIDRQYLPVEFRFTSGPVAASISYDRQDAWFVRCDYTPDQPGTVRLADFVRTHFSLY